jgi:hypothetical protein
MLCEKPIYQTPLGLSLSKPHAQCQEPHHVP